MKVRTHFTRAQRIILRKRGLVGVLYLTNLLFAIALTVPLNSGLNILATSALSKEFINGFFLDIFFDFWQHHAAFFGIMFLFILIFSGIYVLLNIFFTGGILSEISHTSGFSFREFLHASSAFFGRNFRLFLISILVLLAILVVFIFVVLSPLGRIADNMNPAAANRINLLILFLGILIFCLWSMFFDYGKIALFVGDFKSAFRAYAKGAGFVFKNLPKAVGLYFLNFIIVCLLFLAYFTVESLFANNTLVQVYILLAIQQVFMIARTWMKISFLASQHHLYTYVPIPDSSGIRELFSSQGQKI